MIKFLLEYRFTIIPLKYAFIIITLVAMLAIPACTRIKNTGKEIADKAEKIADTVGKRVKETARDLGDKIIPTFNAYEPDTKFNKRRFREFLQVELTPDVKNIYCYDDAIGIDADFQFSFNCDTSTVSRIINKHNLRPDATDKNFGFGLQHDFAWWDKKKIEKLTAYSWSVEHRYYKQFWYDSTEKKAYYFTFDM